MTQLLNFMKLSPYISCKKAALNGMGPFFDELEEMQEQATDAVYDLCEDADSDVRHSPMVVGLVIDICLERFALRGTKYSPSWLRVIIHGPCAIPMYWYSSCKVVCAWSQNCGRVDATDARQRMPTNFRLFGSP